MVGEHTHMVGEERREREELKCEATLQSKAPSSSEVFQSPCQVSNARET